jgi:hypothetical protein
MASRSIGAPSNPFHIAPPPPLEGGPIHVSKGELVNKPIAALMTAAFVAGAFANGSSSDKVKRTPLNSDGVKNMRVTEMGNSTTERPWVGPPISEYGGEPLSYKGSRIVWVNTSAGTRWIFVQGTSGFFVTLTLPPTKSLPVKPTFLDTESGPMTRYEIGAGQTFHLTANSSPPPTVILVP